MRKIRLNLVQLVYFSIISLICIMGLAFWLRDLIILEWDITQEFANLIGYGLVICVIGCCCFVIFAIAKFNSIITKFVSVSELERELNLIKSKD